MVNEGRVEILGASCASIVLGRQGKRRKKVLQTAKQRNVKLLVKRLEDRIPRRSARARSMRGIAGVRSITRSIY